MTKYKALKIWPIHIVSQTETISVRVLMSIIFLIFPVNCLFKVRDFWKYLILGSKNGKTETPYIVRLVLTAGKWFAMAELDMPLWIKNSMKERRTNGINWCTWTWITQQ